MIVILGMWSTITSVNFGKYCSLIKYAEHDQTIAYLVHVLVIFISQLLKKNVCLFPVLLYVIASVKVWCLAFYRVIQVNISLPIIHYFNHRDRHYLKLTLALYSPSITTSYRQISWSLVTAGLDIASIVSLWNLTGISAALLPRCLSTCRGIEKF